MNYGFQVYDDVIFKEDSTMEYSEKADIIQDIRQSLLLELKEQRENILNEAKLEAKKIKLDAKEEGYTKGYDKGLEDGFNQGFNEGNDKGIESGYLQGINNAKDEAKTIKESAIKLFKDAQDEINKYMDENRQRIIRLATQMAESIIHSTIDASSDNIMQLVKPIIQQFKKMENVIITCNPKNYDYLKKSMNGIEEKYSDIKFIILEDESLEKNGCIIENDTQIIDLQIKKQLENILAKLEIME